jgi:hypothetical protein
MLTRLTSASSPRLPGRLGRGDITTDDKEGIILAPQHPGISSRFGQGLRLLVKV